MEILEQWMDEWTKTNIVTAFIRDYCPEERKAEVQALLDASDWPTLDDFMVPFHNVAT